MQDLIFGLFHDNAARGHSYTLAGIRDTLERSVNPSLCFELTPSNHETQDAFTRAISRPYVSFQGVVLDFSLHDCPALRPLQFIADDAYVSTDADFDGDDLDNISGLPKLAAFDYRPWAFFKTTLDRDVPLLPAPMPVHRGSSAPEGARIVLIVNDAHLARHCAASIENLIRLEAPDAEIMRITNTPDAPVAQEVWLDARLLNARAHVHIGFPHVALSAGRVIDSMNTRSPCFVFEGAATDADLGVHLSWERPRLVNEVHFMHTSSMSAVPAAIKSILHDRAWSASLVRNASRAVEEFRLQSHVHLTALMQEKELA